MIPIKTKIAGIPHRKPDLSTLRVGDTVALVPEPTNTYDPNAIKVLSGDVHLGYIPRTDTEAVAATGLSAMFIHDVTPSRRWDEVHIASYPPA